SLFQEWRIQKAARLSSCCGQCSTSRFSTSWTSLRQDDFRHTAIRGDRLTSGRRGTLLMKRRCSVRPPFDRHFPVGYCRRLDDNRLRTLVTAAIFALRVHATPN